MSLIKLKVKDVAADLNMQSKDIMEIVGLYFEKPRSNAQTLTDEQLNALFDHITQKHQVESLQEALHATASAKSSEKTADKAQDKPAEKTAPKQGEKPAQGKPAPKDNRDHRHQDTQQKPNKPAEKAPEKPKEEQRKRERRVVDTSAVTVNADRFDDRVDDMVSERMQNFAGGKQKIGNKNKKKQQDKKAGPGNKRRNEE